jgi:Tfp pilus assembly protein PilF
LRLPFLIAMTVCSAALAQPYLPARDDQVIERLPYKAGDPVMAELRAERSRLTEQPDNLRLAVRLARRYVELGRITVDPRYAGYAQAALMPWWNLERPQQEVRLLRATLRQRNHDFDGALVDLDAVLRSDPRQAQAHLTRASVLQVQGAYRRAWDDCVTLRNLTDELVAATCLTSVGSVSGQLHDSYEQLRLTLERHPDADPEIRSWVLTSLAEMAAHAGLATAAEHHFREALALDPSDFYLLGAYADFLLDESRPLEVIELLRDRTRADPLLLRYVLALKAEASPQLVAEAEQLRARFDASRLRGDRVHLREEARFRLHLAGDAHRALQLAQENWVVQKEVADVRILLESALVTHDAAALATVTDWLQRSRLEDVHIEALRRAVMHPH